MQLMRCKATQGGASLIEVMVALTVLAIGLLGMAQLQNKASQGNQAAYYYSQAMFLADDLVERMRANPANPDGYLVAVGDSLSSVSTTQCETADCTSSQLARWDLKRWKDQLAEILPQGDGAVDRVGDRYIVSIQFDDSKGKLGEQPKQILLEVGF